MKRIYLCPVGGEVLNTCKPIAVRVQEAFGIPTGISPQVEVPSSAYNQERRQYYSSAILLLLERNLPQDALRILGVTAVDIYVPQLNFVFGEAKLGGPSAVISTCRLEPEYYGQPADEEVFLRRVEIEAIHELGHTFGLGHCPDPGCVMHFSNNITDSDRKGPLFCRNCSQMIDSAVHKQTAGSSRPGGP